MSLSFTAEATKAKRLKDTKCIPHRLLFLDQTRGLIMVFMALDHALFFWSSGRMNNEGLPLLLNGTVTFNPLGSSNIIAFLVMFLSNLCAPGFLFIAGYVLALSIKKRELKGISNWNINYYLWQRGMLLILFELFIASPAFNLPLFMQAKSFSVLTVGTFFSFSVLSTIGIGFFILILGRHISPWKLFGLSAVLYLLTQWFIPTLTHNFPLQTAPAQTWQAILVSPVPFSPRLLVNNNFPVIPWFFAMTLGWLYGHTYSEEQGIAYEAKRFAVSGLSSLALFFIFRFSRIGDYLLPDGTFLGFFGLSKYPPSPDYFLLYLGLIFLLLFLFFKLPETSRIAGILATFGRVPLFFYNTHLWLYAAVPAILSSFNGYSLAFGVVIWLLGLLILYPLCHWYLSWRATIKTRSSLKTHSSNIDIHSERTE
ncbi:heparan-alpha-glucosaminide N-acetyltransferase domain-containing protein [Desulfosporosinus sp. OT]|uniref:heparan-alpha-glucosaminide N-acetyltransferase domain-containing protein n=1 Tax=Desulfosporosinus sp. OT TaxID=913865 RepID=UPI000223A475|nr:heparan-alpha-glucosaminide N-acetyltransferase domain-containing protein [Desulfosporosinus sp. OT]EGW38575.1 putative membrane protein [Desulfosporosinus sp. OT]